MHQNSVALPGFEDRTAVITGAAGGIGRQIARALHDQGARVALLDVHLPADIADVEERDRTLVIKCDVTDESSVDQAFGDVEARFGSVDILVNNAGILLQAPIEELELEAWNATLAVNLTGAFLCSRRVLPAMRERRYGRLVHIGSSAGKTGGSRMMAAYAASKAGIMSLARSIASEYAEYGVTSNALAPTLIRTAMIADLLDLAGKVPVGRLGEPEDVAFATLVLASEAASFITGEVMDVNGGWLID